MTRQRPGQARGSPSEAEVGTTVVACGAIAPELAAVIGRLGLDGRIELTGLTPELHNTPADIPERVRTEIRSAHERGRRVVVGYADCGTGGRLDAVCAEEGVERLPGAHCYELFAGTDAFASLHAAEPGTFYLTDFLVRSFDRLVVRGLGLDRHPELRELYFGNYRRLVHLAQSDDADLDARARCAAQLLGLEHERVVTGLGPLRGAVAAALGAGAGDAGSAHSGVDAAVPANPGDRVVAADARTPSTRQRAGSQATGVPG